jgi:anti-sigma regulatory factor (Ser/Thr protein kinase)/putative methionine-R-sulfoxide reductase with GAF domain
VTDSTLARLDADALLAELLDRVREALDVDTVAVLRMQESTRELVATAARGLEEEVRQNTRIPVGRGYAGRIASERRAIAVEEIDESTVVNPLLREKGLRSLLGVPLLADGRVLGVLHVGSLTPRRFTTEEVNLLQVAGDRVALALQERATTSERNAGVALQRSLVPDRLPDIPGLELASRYVPAEDGGVGGDWYDLFVLPSGHVCITIGDVAGRGLRAAVVMGRLRSTVRAYAMEALDPPAVVERVDRKLQHFEPAEMATLLFAVFDPSLRQLSISLAGHPPPVLAVPGEPSRLLDDLPVDPPLGASRVGRRQATVIALPPGAVLCFYTDGLVERRTVGLDERLHQLTSVVTAGPPDEVCQAVMAELVAADPTGDDVALLTIRRLPPERLAGFEMRVPAVPASLSDIRVAMRRWLSVAEAGPEDVIDLLTAVGEACSNAIEHAYGARRGTILVHLERDGSRDIVARVRDDGRWRAPRGSNRGRGLKLMEAASDRVDIIPGPTGTEVVIRRRLGSTTEKT